MKNERTKLQCMVPSCAWVAIALLATACMDPVGSGMDPDAGPEPPRPDGGLYMPDAIIPPPDAGTDGGPGIAASAVKPNVMLLIDRSGSMAEPSDCGMATCPSKWQELLGLGAYLAEAKRMARLGLAMFPSPVADGCSVTSSLRVPLSEADDVDAQILAATMSVIPGGRTPVADAMDAMGRVGGLDDPDRKNILLVLTDGRPNCSCATTDPVCERDAAVAAVQRLRGAAVPVDVDIIGFGSSARDADATLSAMAIAAGDDHYYQADTIEELIGTLYEVAVRNVPCRFNLDEWPEPSQLIVWMDDVEVPVCTTDPCDEGYTYDAMTGVVEMQGASCAALRDGEAHSVWFDTRS